MIPPMFRLTLTVLRATLLLLPSCRSTPRPPDCRQDHSVQFGLNSFLGNLYNSEVRGPLTRPTDADRTNYLNAMANLGVKSIRETFMNWAEIQPHPGAAYQFHPYDDTPQTASDRGIKITALPYPSPRWAPGPPTNPADQLY